MKTVITNEYDKKEEIELIEDDWAWVYAGSILSVVLGSVVGMILFLFL